MACHKSTRKGSLLEQHEVAMRDVCFSSSHQPQLCHGPHGMFMCNMLKTKPVCAPTSRVARLRSFQAR
eukprot:2744307-Amphidinium_carterae.1